MWTNLIDNAADAMGGRGRLLLRTRREGDSVVVDVCDDGAGMPDAVQPQVFDAFFTTKAPGEGSGLGLDSARRIVERAAPRPSVVHHRRGRHDVRGPSAAGAAARVDRAMSLLRGPVSSCGGLDAGRLRRPGREPTQRRHRLRSF